MIFHGRETPAQKKHKKGGTVINGRFLIKKKKGILYVYAVHEREKRAWPLSWGEILEKVVLQLENEFPDVLGRAGTVLHHLAPDVEDDRKIGTLQL